MAEFKDLMKGFGVVTVMNACIYKLKDGKSYVGRGSCQHGSNNAGALKPEDFECTGLYLDTLKIANFTQEGPTKTITGGQYANPLIKYGKTMTCEMQDALGRAQVLKEFFGCDYNETNGRLSVTDKFPGAFAIEGDTFFIEQKTGEKVEVHILIPQFLPEAILTLTQDAEGDATVFDLNGSVNVTKIADAEGDEPREVFYEIRNSRWFEGVQMATDDHNYHDKDDQDVKVVRFYVGDRLYATREAGADYRAPENPTMAGYTFAGWFAMQDGKFNGEAVTGTGLNVGGKIWYAKFAAAETV